MLDYQDIDKAKFRAAVVSWATGTTKANTLWLYGIPDAGKSILATMFCNLFVFFQKNAASKNFPLGGLGNNKLIWLEEFTSALLTPQNATFFKQIFGGQTIRGDNKFQGISSIHKTPILITTNESFATFKTNCSKSTDYDAEAWSSRVIDFTLPYKFPLNDYCPFFDYDEGICGEAIMNWMQVNLLICYCQMLS